MNENATVILSADDATAKALVETIKAATNGEAKWAAYVDAHNVTADSVMAHAVALVAFAYPSLQPIQKQDGVRTKYGRALDAVKRGLRRNLPVIESAEDAPAEDVAEVAEVAEVSESGDLSQVILSWLQAHTAEEVAEAWKVANA